MKCKGMRSRDCLDNFTINRAPKSINRTLPQTLNSLVLPRRSTTIRKELIKVKDWLSDFYNQHEIKSIKKMIILIEQPR